MTKLSKLTALLIAEVIAIIIAVPIIVIMRPDGVTLTPTEAIESAVREALKPTNRGEDRVTAISVADDADGEMGLVFKLNAELPEQRKLNAKGDVVAVLQAIHLSGVAYDQVVVHATFPLVGPLGHISEEPVISAIYSRDIVDGTDWNRFPVEDTYLVADAVDLLFDFKE